MPEFDPEFAEYYEDYGYAPSPSLWARLLAFGSLLHWPIAIWMAIECYRRDPDRAFWIWIILFVPGGPYVYLVLRYVLTRQFRVPSKLQRWTRGKEITRLEAAARQIGNPYQHVQLGEALREVGLHDRAGESYRRALERDPKNTQALWGAALVEYRQKQYASAKDRLQQILEIDPQYKFGDTSLLYGKALRELGETDAAREHMVKHIRRWRQPEALYVLAQLCVEQGDRGQARSYLEGMLLDIDGLPRAMARREAFWKSRGRKLLRKVRT